MDFGASVLAFLSATAQLSKALYKIAIILKNAPADIDELQENLKLLNLVLSAIEKLGHNQDISENSILQDFWDSKRCRLKKDFDSFETIAQRLMTNSTDLLTRTKWLFKKPEVDALKQRLHEDINCLQLLQSLLTT
jgi:hypothetical protein